MQLKKANVINDRIVILINILLIPTLLYLILLHFRNREVFAIKLGMSQLTTATTVEVLSYLIPSLEVIALLMLLFFENRYTYLLSILIFSFYFFYNIYIYTTTGQDCGCSNILFNVSLYYQLLLSFFFALLCIFAVFTTSKK